MLTDRSLERYAGRFVWLSINSENAKNAAFVGKYPIPALPTLLVIDPQREVVTTRHVGALSVNQLGKFLDEGRMSARSDADGMLARADKLAGEGNQAGAAKLYADAIHMAPKEWTRFPRAAEALVVALALTGKNEECVTRANSLYPRLAGTPPGASIASTGLGCVVELDASHERRAALLRTFETATATELTSTSDISADDRSGMYISLIGARETAGDKEGAKKLGKEWVAMLETAASKATTPEQRTVYDSHRLSAYLALETPEMAIPMLTQSAHDFPDDYNPHARMAIAYRAMKKYGDAIAASDRAMRLAYGPRKIGFFRTRADIYIDMGDKEKARKAIEEAIVYAKSLPKEQTRPATIESLQKRLTELK